VEIQAQDLRPDAVIEMTDEELESTNNKRLHTTSNVCTLFVLHQQARNSSMFDVP
jgi:hypothetical protein